MQDVPFRQLPLRRPGFLRRLLQQSLDVNALVEVNNLLATVPLEQLNTSAIRKIELRYDIDLKKTFPLNMQEFYAVYLNFSMSGNWRNYKKDPNLEHLQKLLKLDDAEIQTFHRKIGEKCFMDAVRSVIRDGQYYHYDRQVLQTLAQKLKLTTEDAANISLQLRKEYLDKYLHPILQSHRLSPQHKLELFALAENFDIDLLADTSLKRRLDEYEHYWRLEYEPLPILDTAIEVTKNEQCHFCFGHAHWYEERSISRGVYALTLIKKGAVYLTNKQLIFISNGEKSKIRMEKISRISEQEKGIQIIKETGRNPTIYASEDTPAFLIILTRLLKH